MGIGEIITAGGQAINDLFGSEGSAAAAQSYTGAAALATQNAQLAASSTRIQETQTVRQVNQALGSQVADVAGAGFTESGSALDLLRSSAQQGALAKSLVNIQGAINENSYAAQAGAYSAEAKAAGEASNAGIVSAIASVGGALANNGTLLAAGKTVVSGISSLFSSNSEAIGGNALDPLSGEFAAESNPLDVLSSGVDDAVSSGADLSTSLAASDIGLDTSTLGLGGSISSAESGIADAFSSVTDSVSSAISDIAGESLGDLIPGVGEVLGIGSLLNMIPGIDNVPVIGDIVQGIADVGNFIGSAVGDVVSGIGSIFGSVICTAYYKRGYISREVWFADTRYGYKAGRRIYQGYLFWATPIAKQIARREWVARLLWPIFKHPLYEMAAVEGIGQSTFLGRVSLKLFKSFSFIIGSSFERLTTCH